MSQVLSNFERRLYEAEYPQTGQSQQQQADVFRPVSADRLAPRSSSYQYAGHPAVVDHMGYSDNGYYADNSRTNSYKPAQHPHLVQSLNDGTAYQRPVGRNHMSSLQSHENGYGWLEEEMIRSRPVGRVHQSHLQYAESGFHATEEDRRNGKQRGYAEAPYWSQSSLQAHDNGFGVASAPAYNNRTYHQQWKGQLSTYEDGISAPGGWQPAASKAQYAWRKLESHLATGEQGFTAHPDADVSRYDAGPGHYHPYAHKVTATSVTTLPGAVVQGAAPDTDMDRVRYNPYAGRSQQVSMDMPDFNKLNLNSNGSTSPSAPATPSPRQKANIKTYDGKVTAGQLQTQSYGIGPVDMDIPPAQARIRAHAGRVSESCLKFGQGGVAPPEEEVVRKSSSGTHWATTHDDMYSNYASYR